MGADSVTAAAEWDVVPVGRGHEGLRALAADGFSGGVTDGSAWAMLTNGRVVGVVGGSMAAFADVDLTAHRAPDPALPLLLAMRERSAGARAQYYTEETPLSEVDETLRGGGFTGYVELSENVLSGDYYVVYYGGDRLPVAFVGGSRRLVTGDEAFERADDEVGIYAVHDVDVSVVEVPGDDSDAAAGVAVGGAGAAAPDDPPETDDGVAVPGERDETVGADDGSEGAGDDPPGRPGSEPAPTDGATEEAASGERAVPDDPGASAADDGVDDDDTDEAGSPGSEAHGPADATDAESAPAGAPPVGVGDDGVTDTDGAVADGTEDTGTSAGDTAATDTPADDTVDTDTPPDGTGGADTPVDGAATSDDDVDDERPAEPGGATERLRDERDELREELEGVRAERDELRETVERLRTERDELRERVGGSGDGTALTPATALSGTNLFVRYGSKADPTLERALGEGAGREAVDENLSLEVHTSFEREGATVDGQPFDEFLRSSVEYRFVEWLVRALPYELRDAGAKRPLGRLYEAIPSFDRAEIDGAVAVEGEGEGDADEVTFDVVLRSRKGAPLAVASVFDGREPATEAMLSDLVERARPAAAANESLGAALFVTTSYYAPDALELAEAEASGGGLFGRGAKESYVRLDRSHGFHLCLVEARGDDFHLGVPEL